MCRREGRVGRCGCVGVVCGCVGPWASEGLWVCEGVRGVRMFVREGVRV